MTKYAPKAHNSKDLTGQRFGRLVVLACAGKNRYNRLLWHCRCDCGRDTTVIGNHLRNGNTQSCGCLHRDTVIARITTHGMTHTRTYRLWRGMINRCMNPKADNYARYGGKGVTVCDEWRTDFQSFYDHVSVLPQFGKAGYSLDRINNEHGYEPGNVRWATASQQNRNKQASRLISWNGKSQCLADWATELNLPERILADRLGKLGWDAARAFSTPVNLRKGRHK